MKNQTTLKTILILSMLAMMTACGQGKDDGSSDFSSRTDSTVTPTKTSLATLKCNEKTQDGLDVKLKIYTDTIGNARNDFMNVMLFQVPTDFEKGSFIQFFRWQATSASQTYLDKAPLQARFETLDGRILTNFSPVIYWAQVSQMATNSGYPSANEFLKKVKLVVDVRDPQANYDVLKIAMYNTGNAVTHNLDMLMPAFAASPKDYATENGSARSALLTALHPFAGSINAGYSTAKIQSLAASHCF